MGVRVFQKEPELLYKIATLTKSNAKLYFRDKSGISGAGYLLQINDREIYEDLLQLGLFPNKSLSLVFPDIEPLYIRHFIRGCRDGDGTVYWNDNDIEELIKRLVALGLPDRTIYEDKRRAFYVRYFGKDCAKLYHILYDGVPESMYLTRKYKRFKAIADYFEKYDSLSLSLFSNRLGDSS